MLRERLAELVSQASDGELAVADILAADSGLPALGVTSLTYLRLIDAIESEFGCDIDLDGPFLDTLDGLADHLTRQLDGR
ncbi:MULTISPECIES: acyl carrier protein [Microtetraspora]|uniref:Acyl carrier protein n=1 Tax=Microtetraspora glauca TaxID=1996 RepID=A0ABV3GRX8_MICGL|nr:acyl carrier protein [Microtetraspora sp. AC03309]MCC5581183.1 acyl carrier protein [Microtetraspora sp. AC03309]